MFVAKKKKNSSKFVLNILNQKSKMTISPLQLVKKQFEENQLGNVKIFAEYQIEP